MTVEIPLGGRRGAGRVALVDDIDTWTLDFRWSLDGNGYVQARADGQTKKLHRWLMGYPAGIVDHLNRNPLDNRRSNLRVTDHKGNARNCSKTPGLTSRYMGVYRHTQTGRWVATGSIGGKSKYLGCFSTPEEAAEVSRLWRIRTFGFDRYAGDVND